MIAAIVPHANSLVHLRSGENTEGVLIAHEEVGTAAASALRSTSGSSIPKYAWNDSRCSQSVLLTRMINCCVRLPFCVLSARPMLAGVVSNSGELDLTLA
jgi:hypothetical protein